MTCSAWQFRSTKPPSRKSPLRSVRLKIRVRYPASTSIKRTNCWTCSKAPGVDDPARYEHFDLRAPHRSAGTFANTSLAGTAVDQGRAYWSSVAGDLGFYSDQFQPADLAQSERTGRAV